LWHKGVVNTLRHHPFAFAPRGFVKLWLALAAALAVAALPGCGLPTAVTVATYAADGVSFVATGKRVTDHALSAAVDRDCALLRAMNGDAVCRAKPVIVGKRDARADEGRIAGGTPLPEVAAARVVSQASVWAPVAAVEVAAGREAARPLEMAAAATPGEARAIAESVATVATITVADTRSARRDATASAARSSRWALVLESHADAEKAEAARARYGALRPTVVTATVDGKLTHRVVAGPYTDTEIGAARLEAREAGARTAWAARICPENAPAPSCVALAEGPKP
jgi:hypothetical protein